jgi:hypothetical protein
VTDTSRPGPAGAADGGEPHGGRGSDDARLAEEVRAACVRAALDGYERAAMSGLCQEGAWEAAVEAIRALDLRALLRDRPAGG